MLPSWLSSFFSSWTAAAQGLWTSMLQFRTWGNSAIAALMGTTVQDSGSEMISWVVQWIPVPVRLGILMMAAVFIVGLIEQFVAWVTQHYHPSYVNAFGKRCSGFWD